VRSSRDRRELVRAGELDVDQLGMPAARARQLLLGRAWRSVAGEAITKRAVAAQVRRGVLDVRVSDPHWARMLREIMPRLAGRLASAYPELGVRKFRLHIEGERPASRSLPVSPAAAEDRPEARAGGPAGARRAGEAEPTLPTEERLRRLVRRYLERGQARRPRALNLTE
jgi:hypothetical protein